MDRDILNADDLAWDVETLGITDSSTPSPGLQATAGAPSQRPGQAPATKEKSIWKTAFEETRHFAGGLIAHPAESTKHFSVLRHSHGLVYYQGPATSLAITVFADKPLPANRAIWLQKKGWLGKSGWAAKAIVRANGSWIDVTPDQIGHASKVTPTDERAWQRDISRFHKKATKATRHHATRETNIIRIPAEAGDGYFRLVLCAGDSKKVLCPSPVFRIASLSTSSSSVKGASLSTLPLELGVRAASMIASSHVGAYTQGVTSTVQSQVSSIYSPGVLTQEAIAQGRSVAYNDTGAKKKLDFANEQYRQTRDNMYSGIKPDSSPALGDKKDLGPQAPWPLRFDGKVVKGSGKTAAEINVPTANLSGVSQDIKHKLKGIYFGWVFVTPATTKTLPLEKPPLQTLSTQEKAPLRRPSLESTPTSTSTPSPAKQSLANTIPGMGEWKQAIVIVAPSPSAAHSVAPERAINIYIVHDFHGATFFNARVSVMVMGFLRPWEPHDAGALERAYEDVASTQMLLGRPAWRAEPVLELIRDRNSGRSLTDRYVDARQFGQKQLDRVPLHRVGVRLESGVLKDVGYGRGGLCIKR